jgi:NCS1 family nucleobase:cation symporter-1
VNAVELGPVPAERRTQPPIDLFLIFAGANLVATTMVTGASLYPGFTTGAALAVVVLGSIAGAALVAALAPVGPRLGVPSVVAARAALGTRGAALVAVFLYVTNFAWIAINNVIAGSACATLAGGPSSERAWAVGVGILAPAIVAGGPRLVALADRVAVPLLLALGLMTTVVCLRLPAGGGGAAGIGGLSWVRGLDVVIGYQVSWILMFADYSRYTASPRAGAVAVFLGLAVTSAWFMPLGFLAARAAGRTDPGAMMAAVGLGAAGAILLALATLTTNFVNVYLSALAWKSLLPGAGEQASVWIAGLVGAALGLLSRVWLDRYVDFMLVLGGVLVPVGGVLLGRFFLGRGEVDVRALYDPSGPYAQGRGFAVPGLLAWALGALVYYWAAPIGGTLPSLTAAILAYALIGRWWAPTESVRPAR